MVQLGEVQVTLGESLESLLDKVGVYLRKVAVTDKLWCQWVAHLIDPEADLSEADGRLQLQDEPRLHDHVSEAEQVRHETEVPVGPSVRKLVLEDELEDEQGNSWAANADEGDPILRCENGLRDEVGGHGDVEQAVQPYTILQIQP